MILRIYDEVYQIYTPIRTSIDSLECYVIDKDGFPSKTTFEGISDMTLYKITDNNGNEYTAADLPIESKTSEVDILQLAIVEQYEENLQLKDSITALELAIVELYERGL